MSERGQPPKECHIQNSVWEYVDQKYAGVLKNSDLAGSFRPNGRMLRDNGHPDFIIYYPRGPYHALLIEFKRQRLVNGHVRSTCVTPEQKTYLDELNRLNYLAEVRDNYQDSVELIDWYMSLGEPYCPRQTELIKDYKKLVAHYQVELARYKKAIDQSKRFYATAKELVDPDLMKRIRKAMDKTTTNRSHIATTSTTTEKKKEKPTRKINSPRSSLY